MAGAMRKMGVYLGLVGDDVVEEDYEDYEDVRRDVRGRETRTGDRRPVTDRTDERFDDRYESRSVRTLPETRAVRTFRTDAISERRPAAQPLTDWRPIAVPEITRIETVHPRSYNDARRIGEDYREGVPVIMNLSELDDMDAKIEDIANSLKGFAASAVSALGSLGMLGKLKEAFGRHGCPRIDLVVDMREFMDPARAARGHDG